MRIPRNPVDAAVLSTLLFPLLSAAAGDLSCDHILVDKVAFNLENLGGPRSILHHSGDNSTTITIDICKPLKKVKDIPRDEQCPNGTRVCAINRLVKDGSDTFDEAIPIAGQLKEQGGGDMNSKWERLKSSSSHADSEKEGLRVEYNGGFRRLQSGKRNQKAVVEFICDKTRTGLEHLYEPNNKYTEENVKGTKIEAQDNEGADASSLQFVRYDEGDGDVDVLRLLWRTKFACEGSKEEQDAEKAGHWGFFTWFILIAFLSTATYLIFGSWLNYNRYGARGWDLLPHGDTIRDVPYLFKDWMRRVLNTIQGGGSRGGYAAI